MTSVQMAEMLAAYPPDVNFLAALDELLVTACRVLGEPGPGYGATAVEPSLEDGYIWLMSQARAGEHIPPCRG